MKDLYLILFAGRYVAQRFISLVVLFCALGHSSEMFGQNIVIDADNPELITTQKVDFNCVQPTSIIASTTTICAGNTVTLTQDGGNLDGTGTKWDWYEGTTQGTQPIGNDPYITVNPTSTTSYYVEASGGSCNGVGATITITVNPIGTVSLTSASGSDNQIVCANTGINDVVYSMSGSATGLSVSGNLGAGLSTGFSNGKLTISGTPTTPGTFNYTVATTGAAGNCNNVLTGTLTVTPIPTISLSPSSGVANQSICTGSSINDIVFEIGGAGTSASVSGLENSGLTGSYSNGTFTIGGTVGVAGTYNYTVTAISNASCSVTYSGVITGKPVASSAPAVGGGGAYCVGEDGVNINLSGSQNGVTYQLFKDGVLVPGSDRQGDGVPLSFNNVKGSGTYTVKGFYDNSCATTMTGSATVTENPLPAAPTITASAEEVCEGTVVSLAATTGNPNGQTIDTTTYTHEGIPYIHYKIPSGDPRGVFHTLVINDIPEGAIINDITVMINLDNPKEYFVLNLKGPNGKVLNLFNGKEGDVGHIFESSHINDNASIPINLGTGILPGTYRAQADLGVAGATFVQNNISNVSNLWGLLKGEGVGANGEWTLSARDNQSPANPQNTNEIWAWSITITYIEPDTNGVSVVWTPAEGLFTDIDTTTLYTGQPAERVYFKPSEAGTQTFTATATNGAGCAAAATKNILINSSPVLTLTADYCTDIANNLIDVIATSDINVNENTWRWSLGYESGPDNSVTNSTIKTKVAGAFYVSVSSADNGCSALGSLSIAQELVHNGDFSSGTGPLTGDNYSDYSYRSQPYDYDLKTGGLMSENTYTITNSPRTYHFNFWGVDHTTADGHGNFMIVNGFTTENQIIWGQKNIQVTPNTDYYFSAYAVSLNDISPFANLSFQINGVLVGNPTNVLGTKERNNNPGDWGHFYGTWNSGENTTATLEIINLSTNGDGNDFGLDDISFGTLTTFFNQTSTPASAEQFRCSDSEMESISFQAGGKGDKPAITWYDTNDNVLAKEPDGVETYWNGRDFILRGTPAEDGYFKYKLEFEVCEGDPIVKEGHLEMIPQPDAGKFAGVKEYINQKVLPVCFGSGTATVELTDAVGDITWQSSYDTSVWVNETETQPGQLQLNINPAKQIYLRTIAGWSVGSNATAIGCETPESDIVMIDVPNVWRGTNNEEWGTSNNWSFSTLPNQFGSFTIPCTDVIIPDVGANPYPKITTSVQVPNLMVFDGAHVELSPAGTLNVAGNIMQNGTNKSGYIDATSGTMKFTGTGNQAFQTSIFKDTTVSKLVIANDHTSNNQANVEIDNSSASALAVTDHLTLDNAGAYLTTNDKLVLKSGPEKTASLTKVPVDASGVATAAIIGNITVERYVNVGSNTALGQHGKAWYFLATPTSGQTIRQSWMEDGQTPEGYGTMLSGPGGSSNGWDIWSPAPAIKGYNAATGLYEGASSANIPLYNEHGWMTFVRGDRTVTGASQAANNTVLRSTGSLNMGKITLSVAADATGEGFASFGNPYASAIDMRQVTTSLSNPATSPSMYYIWYPNENGEYGLGSYRSFTKRSDGSYRSVPSNERKDFINSGEAFFVQADAIKNYQITITEDSKVDDVSSNRNYFRPGAFDMNINSVLSTDIYRVGGDIIDGTLQFFGKEFSNEIDPNDGRKMLNSGANLSIQSMSKLLTVERRQPIEAKDTVFYNLTGMNNGIYRFVFDAENMEGPGLNAWLEDAYTNERTSLSLEGNTEAVFEVNNDKESKASDRFRIVFKANPSNVNFVSLEAKENNKFVDVNWVVDNAGGIVKYVVMASTDGLNFKDLAELDATAGTDYSAIDQKPVDGYNYYRIRTENVYGFRSYSDIAKVFVGSREASLRIFPNPVVNGEVNLAMKNYEAGQYRAKLIDVTGNTILVRDFRISGGNHIEKIPWKYELPHGIYHLQVIHPDGTVKLIIVKY